jgi:hypothetical protein
MLAPGKLPLNFSPGRKSNSVNTKPPLGCLNFTDNSALDFLAHKSKDQAMKKWTGIMVAGVLAGAVIFGSLPAVAGPYDGYLNRREMNQKHRINQGWRSGQITPGEFRHLQPQQGRIRAAEARMRADGRLNRWERGRLNRMENRAGRGIYHYRHNNYPPANYGPATFRSPNCRPANFRPVNWRAGWR